MKLARTNIISTLLATFATICLISSSDVLAATEQRDPLGAISFMFGYSKSTSGTTYTLTKHYTGTIAYNLLPITEIELSYSYTDTYFNADPVQTSNTNEQSLGLSLVQSLVPSSWVLQPYVKGGLAQYNRSQSGTVSGIPTPPSNTKSPSAILGVGFRVFFLRNFSLKMEGVTYLPNFKLAEGKNNFHIQGGVSWNF